jgi:hypothetical protein
MHPKHAAPIEVFELVWTEIMIRRDQFSLSLRRVLILERQV